MKKLMLLVALFATLNLYSQSNKGNKYVYIQTYSDKQFQIKDTINPTLLSSKCNNEFEEVEAGMYKIDKSCRLNDLSILVGNQTIKINLDRYRKNKFFNIKIYTATNNEGEQNIIKIKRGDALSIIDNCELEKCNIIMVEFPQIVTINENVEVTINKKFEKYIFK